MADQALRRLLASLAILAAVLVQAGPLSAQGIPSATELQRESIRQQREIERRLDREFLLPGSPSVTGPERPKPEEAPEAKIKFDLKGLVFSQSEFIGAAELQSIRGRYVGRTITFADLLKIVAEVNALYSEKGIITAFATLPPQKVKGGVVKIRLTEGRYGDFEVVGAKALSPEFVKDRFPVVPGTVVDPNALRDQVGDYNLRHQHQIRALLRPGASFGRTDLQLAVIEPPINTLQVFVDNHGTETTGENQRGFFYRRYGPLGIDDRLTVYATNARQDTFSGNVSYNFPIGIEGGRVGLTYSRGAFFIVDGPFQDLDVNGKSNSGSIDYAHLFHVDPFWRITGIVSGTYGNSLTEYSDLALTEEEYRKFGGGFSVAYTDAGRYFAVSANVDRVSHENYVFGRDRKFVVFTGTASALVPVTDRFQFTAEGSWQATAEELLPGSQIYSMGGHTTVRGYPTNALSGDSGYVMNLEAHYTVPDFANGVDLYAFLDHGAIFSTFPTRIPATSFGAGLAIDFTELLGLDLSIARPLNDIVPAQKAFEVYARVRFNPLALPILREER